MVPYRLTIRPVAIVPRDTRGERDLVVREPPVQLPEERSESALTAPSPPAKLE